MLAHTLCPVICLPSLSIPLTNTNNGETFMTQDVVLDGVTARPIRTTVSDPINTILYHQHLLIVCVCVGQKLTFWKDTRHVDGRLQYRLGSCKQQRYHTFFGFVNWENKRREKRKGQNARLICLIYIGNPSEKERSALFETPMLWRL